MTEIHGIAGAPYNTPQVRKKMPEPFARPVIDLDGGRRVKRRWADISVLRLQEGDTVAGFGVVDTIEESILVPKDGGTVRWVVALTNKLGERRDFPGHERVYAFVPERVKP